MLALLLIGAHLIGAAHCQPLPWALSLDAFCVEETPGNRTGCPVEVEPILQFSGTLTNNGTTIRIDDVGAYRPVGAGFVTLQLAFSVNEQASTYADYCLTDECAAANEFTDCAIAAPSAQGLTAGCGISLGETCTYARLGTTGLDAPLTLAIMVDAANTTGAPLLIRYALNQTRAQLPTCSSIAPGAAAAGMLILLFCCCCCLFGCCALFFTGRRGRERRAEAPLLTTATYSW